MDKRKFLLLDIDHTIINKDSMVMFILYSIKKKKLKMISKLPYILFSIFLNIIGLKSTKKTKEVIFDIIKEFREEDISEFFYSSVLKVFNEYSKTLIDSFKKKNYIILMVTASPEKYMKYFEDIGYADKVIGTKLEVKDGQVQIIGKNCKGHEKVKMIEHYLKNHNIEIDYDNSYAYSDSKSDYPMFKLVKNSYLVNKKNGCPLVATG